LDITEIRQMQNHSSRYEIFEKNRNIHILRPQNISLYSKEKLKTQAV